MVFKLVQKVSAPGLSFRLILKYSSLTVKIYLFIYIFTRDIQPNALQGGGEFLCTIYVSSDTAEYLPWHVDRRGQRSPLNTTQNRTRTRDTVTNKGPVRAYRIIILQQRKYRWKRQVSNPGPVNQWTTTLKLGQMAGDSLCIIIYNHTL